jgi:hypothetical protein
MGGPQTSWARVARPTGNSGGLASGSSTAAAQPLEASSVPRRHRDLGVHMDAEALADSLGDAGLDRIDDAEQGLGRPLSDETQARRGSSHERRDGELCVRAVYRRRRRAAPSRTARSRRARSRTRAGRNAGTRPLRVAQTAPGLLLLRRARRTPPSAPRASRRAPTFRAGVARRGSLSRADAAPSKSPGRSEHPTLARHGLDLASAGREFGVVLHG